MPAVTKGMSASISTAPEASAGTAETARRSTLVPPSRRKSLLRPIRLEVPAASTTPAMRPARSSFMDASPLGAQVLRLAACVDREHLRDDADRDLLRTVGAEVEAHRREQLVGLGGAELAQDLLLPRARPEQPQVGERLAEQRAQPIAVVLQGVRLDDGEMAPPQGEAVEPIPGAAEQEARWRREALRGQEGAAVIDDGHLESGLRRQGRQRAGVVARAEHHQGGRREEHVEEDGAAVDLIEAALARLQELRSSLGGGAVDLRRAGRARQLAAREHQRAASAVPFH